VTGDWVLVSDSGSYRLVSLTSRVERLSGYPANYCFSPGGKWFVYYDTTNRQYFSCELSTGNLHNISAALPHGVSSEYPRGVQAQAVAEPAGWLSGDSAVLLYDNYDCWAVDPAGKRRPVNLTGGYGFRHQVKLRLMDQKDASGALLTGFNTINKYNGFYRLVLGPKPRLDSLYMGPYTFYRVESQKPHRYAFDDGMKPLKAADTTIWLVKRESACEAPNYFLTNDFRHFEAVTTLSPQAAYNWLTSELINYRLADGSFVQGILYKPEDLDPTKKYPVLFNIYEQYSHRLYEFPPPGLSRDNLNIPWFVSRGYLVFTPDIHYRWEETIGHWAAMSVIAAARYLSRLPFVDARRLGIQGHSLGAEETDDILVQTGIFSAAAEMAGPTDPMSAYLSTGNETREDYQVWETGQGRMGATPWQQPDRYLRESAVLQANKITTPLLIVHNPQDGAVPYRQGIELFLALRRLKTPVWMLQYPQEGHSIIRSDAALDYTLKLTDFFGYFLHDQPLPGWMSTRH
jgi:dipeptidyl aminopeptidase/acylaminoacyl peptidase